MALTSKANEMRKNGDDVIVLTVGEPDFDTPINICEAAVKAMNEGQTRYVPGKGTPLLQEAIIEKFKKDNNIIYSKEEIMVGVGGKHIIYNAMLATLNPGDEVLIPVLCWSTSLWPLVQSGLKPVFVDVDKDTLNVNSDLLLKKINNKTKVIMLVHVLGNSTNVEKIRKVAQRKKIILIEDTCESLGSKFKNNAKNRKKPPTYLTSSISERANSEKLRFFFILFFQFILPITVAQSLDEIIQGEHRSDQNKIRNEEK